MPLWLLTAYYIVVKCFFSYKLVTNNYFFAVQFSSGTLDMILVDKSFLLC